MPLTTSLPAGCFEPVIGIATPPDPRCRACIIVPARNEQEQLAATLAALSRQTGCDGRPLDRHSYEVIVLANNCSDATAAIARRWASQTAGAPVHVLEHTLPAAFAHIGWVRKLLMDEARRRLLAIGRPDGVIASTDADTRVAPTWLAHTLAEVAGGADAVAGLILTLRSERAAVAPGLRLRLLHVMLYCRLMDKIASYLDPEPYDPWPRHGQHFGASFAVTAAAYQRAGGLHPLPCGEDVALVQALRRSGARIRHSPGVRVYTSLRTSSRTSGGMASWLNTQVAMVARSQPYLVEDVDLTMLRLQAFARLRSAWQRRLQLEKTLLMTLAGHLRVPLDWLLDQIGKSQPFNGLLAELEETAAGAGGKQIAIEQAIFQLQKQLRLMRVSRTCASNRSGNGRYVSRLDG
jgi:hypothetical protein